MPSIVLQIWRKPFLTVTILAVALSFPLPAIAATICKLPWSTVASDVYSRLFSHEMAVAPDYRWTQRAYEVGDNYSKCRFDKSTGRLEYSIDRKITRDGKAHSKLKGRTPTCTIIFPRRKGRKMSKTWKIKTIRARSSTASWKVTQEAQGAVRITLPVRVGRDAYLQITDILMETRNKKDCQDPRGGWRRAFR